MRGYFFVMYDFYFYCINILHIDLYEIRNNLKAYKANRLINLISLIEEFFRLKLKIFLNVFP